MLSTKKKRQYFCMFISLLLTVITALSWKIVHDEVYFLCGNFSKGVERESVIRQLNTATMSDYKQMNLSNGSMILFSSSLNLHYYQCRIEFNENDKVSQASFNESLSWVLGK